MSYEWCATCEGCGEIIVYVFNGEYDDAPASRLKLYDYSNEQGYTSLKKTVCPHCLGYGSLKQRDKNAP